MSEGPAPASKPLGFWSSWSLTVGIMIGSGIFLLPAVLAPYGLISFAGWVLTGTGSICLALVIARLAGRTRRTGGVYVYARSAFGDLAGFLVAWGYWAAYWIAMPAVAIAFVGYLGVFIPSLDTRPLWQAAVALGLIWTLTLVNLRGVRTAGQLQFVMTILKLIPLGVIIALAAVTGDPANLPDARPADGGWLPVLATTALLTMWAFSGLEAGTVPAGDIASPRRTIPKAIVIGTLTVTFVYIASTFAVMSLVPAATLAQSTSPFADAARHLGPWGPGFIAIGALVSTAGALNGIIVIAGQVPMAVAVDRLIPARLASKNAGGAPTTSLVLAACLASGLLLMNFAQGLVAVFTFLIMMSTLANLVPLLVSALAEFRHALTSARGWAAVAALAALYSVFAILGSGLAVLGWGLLLFVAGLPLYFLRERLN